MVSAVIDRVSQRVPEVLIARIPVPPYAGRWTFPCGPLEDGESPEGSLRRALRSLLGMNVRIVCGQPPFDRAWDDVMCRWRFFFCDGTGSKVQNRYFLEVRWVPRATLREYEFDPVSQQVVDWILEDDD
jgi:ADP-ribose pyrophosphatase YjhB (NUDIX family)